jgi:hypothetical protein
MVSEEAAHDLALALNDPTKIVDFEAVSYQNPRMRS